MACSLYRSRSFSLLQSDGVMVTTAGPLPSYVLPDTDAECRVRPFQNPAAFPESECMDKLEIAFRPLTARK